jgi:hypothetical protein
MSFHKAGYSLHSMHNNECVGKFCPNSNSNTWHKINIASKFDYLNITHLQCTVTRGTTKNLIVPLHIKQMIQKYKNIMLCGLVCLDFRGKYWRKTPKKYKMQLYSTQHFNTTILYLTVEVWSIQMMELQTTWMSSGFCCSVNEIFALLGCCTAGISSYLQTFRDNLSVPSSRVKMSKTVENGTNRLSQNVGD